MSMKSRLVFLSLAISGLLTSVVVQAAALTAPLPFAPDSGVSTPQVMSVMWTGRNLIILGSGFDSGCTVVINGIPRKTRNDPDDPTSKLIAKKAAKGLVPGAPFTAQVFNAAGEASAVYSSPPLRTVTQADDGSTIDLVVGEELFVYLGTDYFWSLTPFNTAVISPVPGIGALIRGAQALLQAKREGQTPLVLVGDPPCRQANPPCGRPSLEVQVTIVVHGS